MKQTKLDEAYRHIKPYISKKETPLLIAMCENCECWMGKEHDYTDCKNKPCFKLFLGYTYADWEESWE